MNNYVQASATIETLEGNIPVGKGLVLAYPAHSNEEVRVYSLNLSLEEKIEALKIIEEELRCLF